MPAIDYNVLYSRKKLKAVTGKNTTTALDTLWNQVGIFSVRGDDDRLWKHLLLRFGPDHKLSAKEVRGEEATGEEGELEASLPIVIDKTGATGSVTWQVPDLLAEKDLVGAIAKRISPVKSKEAQLAEEMERKAREASNDSDSDGS